MNIAKQLEEAIADGTKLTPSDAEWLAVAVEVATADPKKRFSVDGVRRAFAAKNGAQYVKIDDERAIAERLVRAKKIVQDRVRPFYKLVKSTKGVGMEFRPSGAGEVEILKDGEAIAVITREVGLGAGSTRRAETSFSIDVYGDAPKGMPGYFDSMTLAKKWATANLS